VLQKADEKPFPALFPENYAYAGRKNFPRNALQSDGIGAAADLCIRKTQSVTAGNEAAGNGYTI